MVTTLYNWSDPRIPPNANWLAIHEPYYDSVSITWFEEKPERSQGQTIGVWFCQSGDYGDLTMVDSESIKYDWRESLEQRPQQIQGNHSPELLQAEIERQRRQIELLQTRNDELTAQIEALRGLVSAMLDIGSLNIESTSRASGGWSQHIGKMKVTDDIIESIIKKDKP